MEEFHACERIQKQVWGNVGVSGELLSVTRKYGGAVLGSVVNGRVVGFIYAFLARRKGRLIHWSHLMAVEPRFRDLGLGFRMKLAHREQALAAGISSICWTYDPLQSRNAALNIGRLGGRAEDFVPNCYGRFPSAIEKGLESDRFVVSWRIRSARVARRLRGFRPEGWVLKSQLRSERINETRLNSAGFPENRRLYLNLNRPSLLVEIPKETDRMRTVALSLARRWRLETRRIFAHYFQLNYRVEDFIPPDSASEGRCFYVLRRRVASA
jgi:predicted GNAT superfamily acetyltransferase